MRSEKQSKELEQSGTREAFAVSGVARILSVANGLQHSPTTTSLRATSVTVSDNHNT